MNKKGNHIKLKDSLEKLVQAQKSLEEAVALPIKHDRDLAGIIQSFEFVYELGWKTLKRLLEVLGHETSSARDAFKAAYKANLLSEEKVWLDILEDRNMTSHTYSKKMAEELVGKVKGRYVGAFRDLVNQIEKRVASL